MFDFSDVSDQLFDNMRIIGCYDQIISVCRHIRRMSGNDIDITTHTSFTAILLAEGVI